MAKGLAACLLSFTCLLTAMPTGDIANILTAKPTPNRSIAKSNDRKPVPTSLTKAKPVASLYASYSSHMHHWFRLTCN